jgi:hypothetical protein
MIGIAELALNALILNLYRDTTGVREVLWVEPEDGNIAFVQFDDDGIGVLIVVVGNDQDCVRHRLHLSDFDHRVPRPSCTHPR